MNNYAQAETTPMDAQSGPVTNQLGAFLEDKNIAQKLDKEELQKISQQVSDGFEYDLRSRADWERNLTEWTNLALQVKEEKNWPWQGASNVKYPLLSTAAMQFNARAYPSLIPATGDVVKVDVIGADPDGQKLEQAKRVSKYMSFQLMHEMESWEDDMDKLLIMLPIVGTVFKKTYYDKTLKHNVSELVLPKDIVVNYWAKSLDCAERISQRLYLNKRHVKERQMSGIYLDVDLGEPQVHQDQNEHVEVVQDATLPYQIIEQHTYYDLDDDGYPEPYIITFERHTKTILRIVARYDEETMFMGEDGKLAKIEPIQYFTKFSFIPNPDGSFYDIGFGLLLGPINESVNTTINQLLDAGTLNNLQGGFLGKGLKLKMGESRWNPGEWKSVQTTADDLRKQIIPLPTKEPSKVLLELMQLLVTSGKELASVAEIFVGKMPGQNTPATTTMATIEQGMKVFTAVYKRIFRSLTDEYKKIFRLNSIHLDLEKYQNVLDQTIPGNDFDEKNYNICPNADPSTPTQTEKLMKAQALLELLQTGTLDPVEVVRRVLDAQEQPSIERLFNQQIQQTGQFQPPPDPKIQIAQMKNEGDQQRLQLEQQKAAFEAQLEQRSQQFEQMMEAQKQEQELRFKALEGMIKAHSLQQQANVKMITAQQQHEQSLVHGAQSHQQNMAHAEEQNKLRNQQTKTSSKNGKATQSPKR